MYIAVCGRGRLRLDLGSIDGANDTFMYQVLSENPIMNVMLQDFIVPPLRHPNAVIRGAALHCVGLCGLYDKVEISHWSGPDGSRSNIMLMANYLGTSATTDAVVQSCL